MKSLNLKKAHLILVFAGVVSNSCAGLMGMLGGMGGLMGGGGGGLTGNNTPQFQGLTDQGSSSELMLSTPDVSPGKTGYVVKASGSIDPAADGSAVYGLFVLNDTAEKKQ